MSRWNLVRTWTRSSTWLILLQPPPAVTPQDRVASGSLHGRRSATPSSHAGRRRLRPHPAHDGRRALDGPHADRRPPDSAVGRGDAAGARDHRRRTPGRIQRAGTSFRAAGSGVARPAAHCASGGDRHAARRLLSRRVVRRQTAIGWRRFGAYFHEQPSARVVAEAERSAVVTHAHPEARYGEAAVTIAPWQAAGTGRGAATFAGLCRPCARAMTRRRAWRAASTRPSRFRRTTRSGTRSSLGNRFARRLSDTVPLAVGIACGLGDFAGGVRHRSRTAATRTRWTRSRAAGSGAGGRRRNSASLARPVSEFSTKATCRSAVAAGLGQGQDCWLARASAPGNVSDPSVTTRRRKPAGNHSRGHPCRPGSPADHIDRDIAVHVWPEWDEEARPPKAHCRPSSVRFAAWRGAMALASSSSVGAPSKRTTRH